MPTPNEIIKLGIQVSSASVTRAGFNTILLVGDERMVDPTQAGPRGEATFDENMVFKYTSADQIGAELIEGHLKDMVSVAFAQSPSVGTVYVSYVDTAGTGAGITATDIEAMEEYEPDWIGYASTFESDADLKTQAGKLSALKKFYSALTTEYAGPKETITDSEGVETEVPIVNTDYAALWHTKTALVVHDADNSETHVSQIGRWSNVASMSFFLAVTQGSYNPAFKSLNLITPLQYSPSQEAQMRAANLNQYSNVGGTAITWDGKVTTGGYIDIYLGAIEMEIRLREDLLQFMVQTAKLPYTDGGISAIGSVIDRRLAQYTRDGYLDASRPYQIKLPRASQLTDRASRNLPGVSFTAFATGAINTVEIQGIIDAT